MVHSEGGLPHERNLPQDAYLNPAQGVAISGFLDPMLPPTPGLGWPTPLGRLAIQVICFRWGRSGFFPGASDRSSMPMGGIFLGNETVQGPSVAERPQHTPGPEPSLGGGTSGLAPGGPIETLRNRDPAGPGPHIPPIAERGKVAPRTW